MVKNIVIIYFLHIADPIIAIATAPGRGAVGIVRVSGRGIGAFVEQLIKRTPNPREAHYLPFPDAQGQPIDHGLALFFPGPHSYTGEDVLELQAHGGPVVLQLLVARCLELARTALPHLRLAERLIARAHVEHVGRTQAVCRCEVFVQNGDAEKLCALAQGTIAALPSTS